MNGDTMTFAKKGIPVPEAIKGERWEVKDSAGTPPRVEFGKKDMFIPLADDDHDRAIRAHEQGHLLGESDKLYTFAGAKELPHLLLNAVEDARVNELVLNRGVTVLNTVGSKSKEFIAEHTPKVTSFGDLVQFMVCTHADKAGVHLREEAAKIFDKDTMHKAEKLANRAVSIIRDRKWTHEGTIAAAKWLQDQLDIQKEQEQIEQKENPVVAAAVQDALDCLNHIDRDIQSIEEELAEYDPHQYKIHKPFADKWGIMHIVTPPRESNLLNKDVLRDRNFKLADTGTRVGRVYRIYTDRKVFKYKKPIPGGTVLIDASGSMSLHSDELVEMIKAAPAVTVAIYSGFGIGAREKYSREGKLIVIVKDGKACTPQVIKRSRQGLGLNIIDGPAVDWLVSMPKPRIWVSDGCVYAYNNNPPSRELFERFKMTLVKGRVMRVGRPSNVGDMLRQIHSGGTKEKTGYEKAYNI